MPKLLLNLRLATDDEAAETRELLDQHQVDWYETQPGFWGISAGGIWLRDLERAAEVKALLKQYQSEDEACTESYQVLLYFLWPISSKNHQTASCNFCKCSRETE